jgi:hypothetical protein
LGGDNNRQDGFAGTNVIFQEFFDWFGLEELLFRRKKD